MKKLIEAVATMAAALSHAHPDMSTKVPELLAEHVKENKLDVPALLAEHCKRIGYAPKAKSKVAAEKPTPEAKPKGKRAAAT